MINKLLFASLLLLTTCPLIVRAGSFSVTPAKIELSLNPGVKAEQKISLTNKSREITKFTVDLRDLAASNRPDEVLRLLGDELGPYSLKPYLELSATNFSLAPGETKEIIIKIDIPKEVPPGGRFGAITFKTEPKLGSGARFSAQIASLFFLRIPGEMAAEGRLLGLQISGNKIIIGKPLRFLFSFENTGNVYLNPYGGLDLKARLALPGTSVAVPPNFVLPDSTRIREINLKNNWRLAGWYEAELKLNRGYDNKIDQAKVQIVVLPWWLIIVLGFLALVLIVWLVLKLKQPDL